MSACFERMSQTFTNVPPPVTASVSQLDLCRSQMVSMCLAHLTLLFYASVATYYLNVLFPELFQKNGYDLYDCNNVRVILYNTDVISHIVKLIVHSPVGKLV